MVGTSPPIRAFSDAVPGMNAYLPTSAGSSYHHNRDAHEEPKRGLVHIRSSHCSPLLHSITSPYYTRFSFLSSTTTIYHDAPPRALHGARSHPHPWHLPPLPTTFCATRLLSRCFRRLRSRSFAQAVVERRGYTVCGGCASSSAAYQEVGRPTDLQVEP